MKLKQPIIQMLMIKHLKTLPFNRAINMKHITALLNSMITYGILRVPVILRTTIFGKKDDYILDAQHMVSALIKADVKEVPCIVIEENNITQIINTMAALNNTLSTWKIDDYVNAFTHMPGKEDYKLLKVHHLSTGFNYTVSSKILNGTTGGIKNGKFKLNCTDADDMTKNLIEVTSLFDTNSCKFMLAYLTFARSVKKYDHKKFMQFAARSKKQFIISDDTTMMVNLFHGIYK
jgi:hypothetical protein